jgi:hypothetical protein
LWTHDSAISFTNEFVDIGIQICWQFASSCRNLQTGSGKQNSARRGKMICGAIAGSAAVFSDVIWLSM